MIHQGAMYPTHCRGQPVLAERCRGGDGRSTLVATGADLTAGHLAKLKGDRPGRVRPGVAGGREVAAVVSVGRPARVSPTHDVAVGRRRRASSRSMTSSADLHVQSNVTTGEMAGLL